MFSGNFGTPSGAHRFADMNIDDDFLKVLLFHEENEINLTHEVSLVSREESLCSTTPTRKEPTRRSEPVETLFGQGENDVEILDNIFSTDFEDISVIGEVHNASPSTSKRKFQSKNAELLAEEKLIDKFLKLKEIPHMYEWQKDCLQTIRHKNCVLSMPTSGGKTLVGEILMMKEIMLNQKSAIFVLPFIALVQEKYLALSKAAETFSFFLEEYAGTKGKYPPVKRKLNKKTIYICTIEKASKLVTCLYKEDRLDEIGLMVIDEFHMLNEPQRGPILEFLVTKILYLQRNIQIFTMSATVGNIDMLASFIKGEKYIAEKFNEEIPFHEYIRYAGRTNIVLKNNIVEAKPEHLNHLSRGGFQPASSCPYQNDPEGLLSLVQDKMMCLIFCATKKGCENLALRLKSERFSHSAVQWKQQERQDLIEAIKAESHQEICPVLRDCIPYGVAYHHSDLSPGQRKLLEEAYMAQTLQVVCCTSTLAVGVNLPAERVIIREPFIGRNFMSYNMYKQMIGRAGRTGLQEKGESVVICKTQGEYKDMCQLIRNGCELVQSKMEPLEMTDFILDVISTNICSSATELIKLFQGSLLCQQKSSEEQNILLNDVIPGILERLLAEQDGTLLTNTENLLKLTPLANAAVQSGFSNIVAVTIYNELIAHKRSLCLLNNVHLLYLIVPIQYCLTRIISPEMMSRRFSQLTPLALEVARNLGVTENIIALNEVNRLKEEKQILLNRFFLANLISELLAREFTAVAKTYKISPLSLQTFLENTAYHVFRVFKMCEELPELYCYKQLLMDLPQTLMDRLAPDIKAFMDLPGVQIGRARQLVRAGYTTLEDLARADPREMASNIHHLPLRTAREIINTAKLHFIHKMDTVADMKTIIANLEATYLKIVNNSAENNKAVLKACDNILESPVPKKSKIS